VKLEELAFLQRTSFVSIAHPCTSGYGSIPIDTFLVG